MYPYDLNTENKSYSQTIPNYSHKTHTKPILTHQPPKTHTHVPLSTPIDHHLDNDKPQPEPIILY